MAAIVLCFLAAQMVTQTPLSTGQKPPLEAHASLEGQDALSGNAGTLGFQEGFGFSYRHIGPPRQGNSDAFLAAYAPVSFLTLGVGVEYMRYGQGAFAQDYVQGSIGLGVRPSKALSMALIYRPFIGIGILRNAQLGTWDFGIALRPARWLSFTAAIENFSQPVSSAFVLPRVWALSAALRPWRNDWLSIGADIRMRETSDLRQWPAPRFTLDIRPASFIGVLLSATTTGEVFAGLSLRSRYVELGGALGASRESGLQSSYAFARIASVAHPGLHFSGKSTVQMALKGDLRPTDFWSILRLAPTHYGEVLLEMEALADNPEVKGVRLVFQGFDCGFATLEELRSAIANLRAHGKWVSAELGDADDRDLFVASAADTIIMEPGASLHFDGLKLTLRNFKGTLDRLGVHVSAHKSGPFKNAPDAFTQKEPSPQQLQVQNALLDGAFKALTKAVGDGRKLSQEKLLTLIDKGIFTAAEAQAVGLIDALAYDPDPAVPPRGSRYENLVKAGSEVVKRREWNGPPVVALVQIEGTIAAGDSFADPFGLVSIAGAKTIVPALEEARADDNVKAVVVRINSPGGDILASDFIWQAMRRLQLAKPLVVSMGDTAASGGYYAALPADVIFAGAQTITGSIGVFSVKLDLTGLYDKLGVSHTVLTRGAHADMLDTTRAETQAEAAAQAAHIEALYQDFLRKVAHARKKDVAAIDAVARGRVWNGAAAKEYGLVDKLGGLLDAIKEARSLAGYKETAIVDVQPFPEQTAMFGRFAAEVQARLGIDIRPAASIEQLVSLVTRLHAIFDGRAQYLMPAQWELR